MLTPASRRGFSIYKRLQDVLQVYEANPLFYKRPQYFG